MKRQEGFSNHHHHQHNLSNPGAKLYRCRPINEKEEKEARVIRKRKKDKYGKDENERKGKKPLLMITINVIRQIRRQSQFE